MSKEFSKKGSISVVIPVYNGSKTLGELCLRIANVIEKGLKCNYEIILVDDCSKDDSWEVMKKLHQENKFIKIINLANNFGQHSAILCGLNESSGDYVLTMDDDLQHRPEEIPKLYYHLLENPEIDVVIGSYTSKKHSIIRNLGSNLMKILTFKILNPEIKIRFTSLRLMRKNIVESICHIHVDRPRIGTLIIHSTNRISSVLVNHDERKYGKSGYTYFRLFKDMILNIINNSTLPLKAFSMFGITVSFISFLLGLYFIIRYIFYGSSVQGWSSLAVMILFFSGIILFVLGIIGEYLLRIILETKKMPNYVIRDKYI